MGNVGKIIIIRICEENLCQRRATGDGQTMSTPDPPLFT